MLPESCGEEQDPHSPPRPRLVHEALPLLGWGEGALEGGREPRGPSAAPPGLLGLLGLGPGGGAFSHGERRETARWPLEGNGWNALARTMHSDEGGWAGTVFHEEKCSPSLLSGKKQRVRKDPVFGQTRLLC